MCHLCGSNSQSKEWNEKLLKWGDTKWGEQIRGLNAYITYFNLRVEGKSHHDALMQFRKTLTPMNFDGPSSRFEIIDDNKPIMCQMCTTCGGIWSIGTKAKDKK